AGRIAEELTDYLTDTLCREDLKGLITEDGAWEAFVEAAGLSSEQEDALRDALNERLAQEPTDGDDETQRELQKKRFLQQFPELKSKLEGHIRKLRELADHIDQVHKDCTISNVVAGSTSTASGVLSILGLVLAPFTGGSSLMLTATTLGLGAAAAITSATTTIVEESHRVSDEAEADQLVKASMDTLCDMIGIIPKISVKLYTSGRAVAKVGKFIRHQLRAFKMARGSFRFGSAPTRVRVASVGFAGVMLGLDVYHLVTDSMDLYNGATTESARALQDLAQKLEEKLQEFEQIHKALQSDLPQ
ncbi:apolipoprotein L3-like, partial [Onychomys torridus]|uniref:apolipoprotein L3-like n=1 Tax=Onychomys torridus TaxID=38674 RepID=UPI00167F751D